MDLPDYTRIDDIDDLILGRYIRWVYTDNLSKVYAGGFLVSITNTTLLLKNRRLFTVSFEDAFVFQKMSLDERIVKYAKKYAK